MTTRPPPAVATRRAALVGCAISLSALCSPALAVNGPAAPAGAVVAATPNIEDEPVRYRQPSVAAAGNGTRPATPAADAVGDLSRVVGALLIVIAIIFGLRWAARRMSLVPPTGASHRGVRLLSRTVLSPRQQVLLLQVGRRVVVVADAGASGMRPLCEITDPDEVAALIGDALAAAAAATPPAARSFAALFRRAAGPFDGSAAAAADDPPALAPAAAEPAEPSSDVVGLLAKVRGMRQQFDR